ncbi:MAG: PKD domain-containing protein, partial [Chitinophagales bacterium]|nr:PKD domain-containing protein [Chitinophagales bacterium]
LYMGFGDGAFAAGQSVSHVYTTPGIYTVTIYANDPNACESLDTATVVVDFTHVVQAELSEYEYFGCPPLTINFSNIGYGGITFFWDFGDGNTSTEQNPTHVYPNPGTYYGFEIVTDPTACKPSDTALFTVTVYDFPPTVAFSFNPTTVVGYSTPIHFTNESQGASYYFWDFGDGDTSTEVNPIHTYTLTGDYLVCLTAYNDGSCPAKDCKLIHVELIPIVDVPNAFSPNGDGANDVLYVKGQDVKSLSFKVFNRWGELVFETNDINKGWNGIYKGMPQEMEVYVWELNAIFSDGKAATRSGNVTLLR